MKQAVALAAVLSLTILSGCLENGAGEEAPVFGAVQAEQLKPGYYQFTHRGGDLALSVPSDNYARFDLFNGDDERLGRVELGDGGFADSLSIAGAAGEYVLALVDLHVVRHGPESSAPDGEPQDAQPEHYNPENYTPELRIQSAGRDVTSFLPLGMHVERHVLVDREFNNAGFIGDPAGFAGSSGQPLAESIELQLARTPVDLRIYVAGSADELQLVGRGAGGIIFDASDSYSAPFAHLRSMSRMYYPENVVDNALQITIDAQRQDGPVVLEAHSYSRYLPGEGANARILEMERPGDGVTFTYGDLPQLPVRIEVSGAATMLQAWTEHPNAEHSASTECSTQDGCSSESAMETVHAWLAVYDPLDQKVGSFRVESGQRLEIPVDQAGGYVVYALDGVVTVGTDAAPRDFEMHPLEIRTVELGSASPGTRSSYGQATGDINVTGVPFRVQAHMRHAQPENFMDQVVNFGDCSSGGSVRLFANGETLAFAGENLPNTFWNANSQLPTSGMSFEQYGFDGNCGQMGLAVHAYLR